MGIVINKETGLAENLPNAEQAVLEGTHDVPLIAPDGAEMVAPAGEAVGLLQQGYKQPTSKQLKTMLREADASTVAGQVKAGLEGLAAGATLGTSVGIERALGVHPDDMRARAEMNPITRGAGEAIGFLAPAALAPEVAFTSKLGTAATKMAIEGAMFQAGDEVGKAFMNDPNQSVESALAHTGLAAVLGAGFGGASKGTQLLWENGAGKKLKTYLSNPEVINTLWSNIPSVVGGTIAKATGHNPLVGAAIAKAGNFIGKEAPEAVHLAILKMLGTAAPEVEASGLRAVAQLANAQIKTDKQISKGVQAIFDRGYKFDPMAKTKTDISQLKDVLDKLEQNQEALLSVGGKLGIYADGHASALGMTAGRAVQYLKSLKPQAIAAQPLDSQPVASKAQEARYNQALLMANNPLQVLESIRKGTLTPTEIKDMQNLYPSLYAAVQQKVMGGLVKAKTDGVNIPYATKLALSMFLAQPLDSSMTPGALQGIQSTFVPPQAMQPSMPASKSKGLQKMPAMYNTPEQQRTAHRNK